MGQLAEEVPQVGVDLEGEGVQSLGAVEGHRRHAVRDVEPEVFPLVGEPRGGAERTHADVAQLIRTPATR